MPVSCAAIGRSPTAIFPENAQARELFERVGSVHVLPDEASFEAASALGAYYAWVFALVGEVSRVNDDYVDNHFYDPVGRFPDIEENEPPLYPLYDDYKRYYRYAY